MGQSGGGDVMDAPFKKWLQTGLHARYGAVAAAPPRSRDAEGGGPALGLVLAVLLSVLFWTVLATAVRALWG